jgi:hypothetical protein
MKGWKTLVSGIGMMIWAVSGYMLKLIDANQAIEQFMAGFAIIGMGHKLDKIGG